MSTTTTFQATDNVQVSDHARENWYSRYWDDGERDEPPETVADAWRAARGYPVNWGRHNSIFVRMHPETRALLFARRLCTPRGAQTVVLTVMPYTWQLERPAVRRTLEEVRRDER